MEQARIIRVETETTPTGLLRATSPDLKALHVAGHSNRDLNVGIKASLEALFEARGDRVRAFAVEASEIKAADRTMPPAWVVVPKDG